MEDLISVATSFSKYLRFQICKKQNQTLNRNTYSQKIQGSQIKGGLEVCDAILLENQNLPFVGVEDVITRYKNLVLQFKKELVKINVEKSYEDYTQLKLDSYFGKRKKAVIRAVDFEKEIRLAVLRGSLKACEKLLNEHEQEPKDIIDILGDVHILRMNLWNSYASTSPKIRKVDVLDTMLVNPARNRLILK